MTIIKKIKTIMATKTVKEKTVKPSSVCEKCQGIGRIPQKVEWHHLSCDECKGTGLAK